MEILKPGLGLQNYTGIDDDEPEDKPVQTELYPEADRMPVFWANLTAQEKIVINQGGTSSGKSHALIRIMFFLAMKYPKIKIEVVGATVPKLVGDTLEIAEGIYRDNPIVNAAVSAYVKNPHQFRFKNRSKIIFKSYETAKDADGPRRHILYISEARNFQWATVEQLLKRTKLKAFIDYNPVEMFWAHDKLINCPVNPRTGKKEYPSVKVIRSWHIHNAFLSDEVREGIENIADPEMWKAYARGYTARVSGMCYPGWVQVQSFPLAEKVVWGCDLGYTNDPTCIVKVAINPYRWASDPQGNLYKERLPFDYVFQELCYAPGIASGQMKRILVEHGYKKTEPLYMDHDKTVRRELRSLKVNAIFANKGPGCIAARVLHLRTRKVGYTVKSENIHAERARYYFFKDKEDRITNEPNEGNDHAMNACEYGSFSHAVRHGLIKGWAKQEEGDDYGAE